MRGQGLTWGDLSQIETHLRAAVLSLNKRNISGVTMIEAVDEAAVWPQGLGDLDLKGAGIGLDSLIARVPLLICAIASEIGFAYEGVGTIFWAHFDAVIGIVANLVQRQNIAEIFASKLNVMAFHIQPKAPSASIFDRRLVNCQRIATIRLSRPGHATARGALAAAGDAGDRLAQHPEFRNRCPRVASVSPGTD
jgi:hypothetical protein